MVHDLTRRKVLRLSLAAAAGAAVASQVASGATARSGGAGPEIPEVPGMTGDPRANEFWYQMDERFFFNPAPEVVDAFIAFSTAIGGYNRIWDLWRQSRQEGTYPGSFHSLVAPTRDALSYISGEEIKLYHEFYPELRWGHRGRLVKAFVQFGEGTLFDPRRPAGMEVHTMDPSDGGPPKNYHRWYALLQARRLLGVDTGFWRKIDNLIGLAWAIQSIARPAMDRPNPPLPPRVVAREKRIWLLRTHAELDTAFEQFPYPADD